MGLSCILGHTWSGCKCSKCGRTRDEGHDWSKDCEKCSKCGRTRDEGHDWSGCKCSKCGKTRDEGHDWSKDCEKCSKCGRIRVDWHRWNGDQCTRCEKTDVSVKARFEAVKKDDLAKVELLLGHDRKSSYSALPSQRNFVFMKDHEGRTPLHWAAQQDHKTMAELLLDNGADVNDRNNSGNTPLHEAALNGHKDIAELLLVNNADVNAVDHDGVTPLRSATENDHKEVTIVLLAKGALWSKTRDEDGGLYLYDILSPLVNWSSVEKAIASIADHLRWALTRPPNLNLNARWHGLTPLMMAAQYALSEKSVDLLINAGADVNTSTPRNR